MSEDVWLSLAESGGTPVGRRRGACGCRSFSGGPRSEPDWHLSAHPALQRCVTCSSRLASACRVPAGFPSPFRRFALRIPPGIRYPSTAWPPSPCGRLSRPPWRGVTPATTTGPLSPWDSRPVGDPAFVPVIRASATQAPRSSPWMPSLGIAPALEVRPHPTPCARSAGPRFHASFRRGRSIYPGWRLGFRQSSFSRIARVPSARRPYASARPLVSWHALVPFTFQIQVSHQTQEYPPNSSRLHRGYDRAPRGAGWYLVWFWFAEPPGRAAAPRRLTVLRCAVPSKAPCRFSELTPGFVRTSFCGKDDGAMAGSRYDASTKARAIRLVREHGGTTRHNGRRSRRSRQAGDGRILVAFPGVCAFRLTARSG